MGRVLFRGNKSGQKAFFDKVILSTSAPSLRGLLQFGIDIPYSTLKNYYCGARLMGEELFDDFLAISSFSREDFVFEIISSSWGQQKGGRISKRRK